jgi:hypothetical protein
MKRKTDLTEVNRSKKIPRAPSILQEKAVPLQEHIGRKRTVGHVQGNWPSYIYIDGALLD